MESTAGTAPRTAKLLQVLGVAFGLAIIVGNTIGVGILRSPGDVAAALPNSGWFIGAWVAGGIYALFGAMTMAELAVMIPKSGGQYVYARRALGEYPAFVIGWTDWISTSGATAATAIGAEKPFLAASPGSVLQSRNAREAEQRIRQGRKETGYGQGVSAVQIAR